MKSKNNQNIVQARFLADVVILQMRAAPVDLEIGAVINGTVESGVIRVKEAPQAILVRLLDIAEALGVMYSLHDGAIMFDFRDANELTQENFFHEERGP